MTQWQEAHRCALQACLDVKVIQGCGVNMLENPQKLVCMTLVPRTSLRLPATRNPSLVFQLRSLTLMNLEDHFQKEPGYREDWARGAPIRASLCDRFKHHPLFVGQVPVLLRVQGLSLTQFVYYPQYRAHPDLHSTAALLEPVRAEILKDIFTLAKASINGDFPLRKPGNDETCWALPGRFVRSNGAWTWQPFFSDWDQYRSGQHRVLDETLVSLRSGLPPTELLAALKVLAV